MMNNDRDGLSKLSKSKDDKWLNACENTGKVVGTALGISVLGIIKYSKILLNKIKEGKK